MAAATRCTLDEAGARRQLERYRRLGHGARVVEHSRRQISVELRDDVDPDLVAQTVAIERACCPFFTVHWDQAARRLSFSVCGSEHEPALDAIFFALGLAVTTASPAT